MDDGVRAELPDGVRAARREDAPALARVLARAFREDPFHRWLFPSERAWRWRSHRSFAALLRVYVARETVFTTRHGEGAAIWISPHPPRPTPREELGLALRFLPLLGTRMRLGMEGFRRIGAAHPREPHWYLAVLGTDPPHQGRGAGSALVEAMLARADAEGLPAYLEASRAENVPYYERFGFRVLQEVRMPRDGPSVWAMLREVEAGARRRAP